MSILEISTVGYAFCAILTYASWWKKPYIKAEPTLIKVDVHSELYARLFYTPRSFIPGTQLPEHAEPHAVAEMEQKSQRMVDEELEEPGPSDDKESDRKYRSSLRFSAESGRCLQFCAWSAISLLHSTFYVFAWNTYLPTEIDRVIWKTCALVSIILGPVMVHVLNVLHHDHDEHVHLSVLGVQEGDTRRIYATVACAFVLARSCMITEVLRELPYLPDDAFRVPSWSEFLPYFS